MVPSIRRGMLAMSLTLVGFALWQAYRVTAQTAGESTMTLNDGAEKLRCKIVKVTVRENGTKLYDLEVIGTGEKLKVEEIVHPPAAGSERERRFLPLRIIQRMRNRATDQTADTETQTVKQTGQGGDTGALHSKVVQSAAPQSEGKRVGDRLIQRVNTRSNDRKKMEESVASETQPPRVENTVEYPRGAGAEAYISSHPAALPKVANRLTQIMPSGRPTGTDRPGPYPHPSMAPSTMVTETIVTEPRQGVASRSRTPVQGYPAPEPRTPATGLIPKWMGQHSRVPQTYTPSASSAGPAVASHRPNSNAPARPAVPTQNQLAAKPAPSAPAPTGGSNLAIPGSKANEMATAPNSVIFGQSPVAALAAAGTKPSPKAAAMQAPMNKPQSGRLPAGAGSVIAARSGIGAQVTFVPVPIVTVPDPLRRPSPPAPKIPDPPQANRYVNAFTPTQNGRPMQPGTMAMVPPNFAYMNPYLTQPGMVPMPRMNGHMMPMQSASVANPYAAMRPIAHVNYPIHYQGPMPPNPMMRPQVAPMYYGHPVPMYPAMHMVPSPAMPMQSMNVEHLMQMLRDSPYPSQREWAARTLTAGDARMQQHIVPVLVEAAQKDPAASVRAGCVACLSHMGLPPNQMHDTLFALQNDTDPRVRQEVTQALARTGVPHQPGTDHPVIQPVRVVP